MTTILKFSEKESGLIFASFGIMIGVYSIALSNLPKLITLRNTFILGNTMGCIGYSMVLTFKDRYVQYVMILIFLMFAISVNLTNTKLGVKYYTFPKSRTIAFTIYYLVFFVAGGFASGIVDIMFTFYKDEDYLYEIIFIIGLSLYVVTLILSFFLKEIDIENTDEPTQIRVMSGKEVIKLRSFWQLCAIVGLVVISKSVYFHLSGTLPVYMSRNMENGTHFGLMMVVHQIILLIATPIFTYLVFYFDKYTILMIGTFITSISPLILFFENSYLGVTIFVFLISIGEGIYAPRLTDYTIEISPSGAEAVFLGIAASPNSLSLIVTGISSGLLMQNYCKDDLVDCHYIWIWITFYATSAVLVMLLFRRFIEVKSLT